MAERPKTKRRATEKSRQPSARASARRHVRFAVQAPPESVVFLVGSFNGWDPAVNPMIHDGDGTYALSLPLDLGRHEYKFVVNGDWLHDPKGAVQVPNAFGSWNTVLVLD